MVTSNRFVLIPKFDDANTLGIIMKIINGFTIPLYGKQVSADCNTFNLIFLFDIS